MRKVEIPSPQGGKGVFKLNQGAGRPCSHGNLTLIKSCPGSRGTAQANSERSPPPSQHTPKTPNCLPFSRPPRTRSSSVHPRNPSPTLIHTSSSIHTHPSNNQPRPPHTPRPVKLLESARKRIPQDLHPQDPHPQDRTCTLPRRPTLQRPTAAP